MKDTYSNSGFSGNGIIVVPLAPDGPVRAMKVGRPSGVSLLHRLNFYRVDFPPEPPKLKFQRAARAKPVAIEADSAIEPAVLPRLYHSGRFQTIGPLPGAANSPAS